MKVLNKNVKNILNSKEIDREITVNGWIKTKRESKTFCFLELNDGSTIKNLQIIIDNTLDNYNKLMNDLKTGTSVTIKGKLIKSHGKEQELEVQASTVNILGKLIDEDYPLQKKRHSFEFLREIAHLRPRTNTFGAITRVRNAVSHAIHNFFQSKDFLYLHTPIITSSDCEGAGEMFQVTTLPLENIPIENNDIDYSQDFFGKKTTLTVSGQLEGEIYASALGNIYTFGPTFRAEHSNTTRHLAEFWMVEPEMAFCNIIGNMDLAEEFLKYIINYVLNNCTDDINFFNKWIDKDLLNNLNNIIESDFERITYTKAIEILKKAKINFEYPVSWGVDLQSEHEKYLTEKIFKKPVIVIDYPKEIKAFYMKINDDGKTVRAMDILFPRLGEIVGGSERENNYNTLKQRIIETGLNIDDYWWYLDLRKYGSIPHSGFGLGFERIIQFITGMQNIRDVIPFPRAFKTANF